MKCTYILIPAQVIQAFVAYMSLLQLFHLLPILVRNIYFINMKVLPFFSRLKNFLIYLLVLAKGA